MIMYTLTATRRIIASSRLLAITFLIAGSLHTVRAQGVGLAVGTAAPGAAVQSLDGKAIDLAQYIGKTPVVLEFWATWCPLCKKLEPALEAARQKYAGRVTFVSVGVNNNQTPDKQKMYAAEQHIGGEFVFDKDGNAVAAYKAPHTSYLVVIDASGKVVYTGAGADQDVAVAVAKGVGMMEHGK
jgi:thiol-disulfide isomerase/thioredoxin